MSRVSRRWFLGHRSFHAADRSVWAPRWVPWPPWRHGDLGAIWRRAWDEGWASLTVGQHLRWKAKSLGRWNKSELQRALWPWWFHFRRNAICTDVFLLACRINVYNCDASWLTPPLFFRKTFMFLEKRHFSGSNQAGVAIFPVVQNKNSCRRTRSVGVGSNIKKRRRAATLALVGFRRDGASDEWLPSATLVDSRSWGKPGPQCLQ